MKTMRKWKEDPIVQEVHRVREKLAKEWAKILKHSTNG